MNFKQIIYTALAAGGLYVLGGCSSKVLNSNLPKYDFVYVSVENSRGDLALRYGDGEKIDFNGPYDNIRNIDSLDGKLCFLGEDKDGLGAYVVDKSELGDNPGYVDADEIARFEPRKVNKVALSDKGVFYITSDGTIYGPQGDFILEAGSVESFDVSGDGKRIVYSSGIDGVSVYNVNSGEKPRLIGRGTRVKISDNGKYVAFLCSEENDSYHGPGFLRIYDLDKGKSSDPSFGKDKDGRGRPITPSYISDDMISFWGIFDADGSRSSLITARKVGDEWDVKDLGGFGLNKRDAKFFKTVKQGVYLRE